MLPNDQAKYQGDSRQPIRGVNAGAIFSRAISLYRDNFGRFVTIALLAVLPIVLLQIGISIFAFSGFASSSGVTSQILGLANGQVSSTTVTNPALFLLTGFAIGILLAIPALIGSGAVVAAAANAYLGRQITIRAAFQAAFAAIAGLLVLLVLEQLLNVLQQAAARLNLTFSLIVGVAYLVFLLLVMVRLQVARQAVVLERIDGLGSLRRSWDLIGSDYSGAAFGLWLRLVVVFILPLVVMLLIVGGLLLYGSTSLAGSVIVTILTTLLTVLITPIFDIAFTILYIHLRGEREQADVGTLLAGFPAEGGQKQAG